MCVCVRERECGERESERERVNRRNSSSRPSCSTYPEMKGERGREREEVNES